MTTLLLSNRHTEDHQAIWRAAIRRDWEVVRVKGIRVPKIDDDDIVIYVESLYAPTIAYELGMRLLEPAEDWLPNLQKQYTRRDICLKTLREARTLTSPAFVKPPNEKSFTARVYENGTELPNGFDDDMAVLISEPVAWDVEFRCFCLDSRVLTLSPYLRQGALSRDEDFAATEVEVQAARAMTESVLADATVTLPRAVVIDVGRLANGDWAVVEANAAWGSGIYGCDPDAVLDVVREAIVKDG